MALDDDDCGAGGAASAARRRGAAAPASPAAVARRVARRAVRPLSPAPFASDDGSSGGGGGAPSQQLWVAAWVDYSAKYGVGYMLSNAVIGVYFNDSTKAVLSPDGSTFEYIERHSHGRAPPQTRLDDCPTAAVLCGGDGVYRVRASLARFPAELTKKVTLLRHFQALLLESYRRRTAATAAERAAVGGGGRLRAPPPPRRVALDGELPAAEPPDAEALSTDGTAVNGGALLYVGADEARAHEAGLAAVRLLSREAMMDEDAAGGGGGGGGGGAGAASAESLERAPSGAGSGGAMPFIKKFVRSRRCMMFRLSTRAVHFAFYDGTALLLTDGGRRAVYTDRAANRVAFASAELLAARTALAARVPAAAAAAAAGGAWAAAGEPGAPGTEHDWLALCVDALRRARYAKESIGQWAGLTAAGGGGGAAAAAAAAAAQTR